MDVTQFVFVLFKYVEDQYPIECLSKRALKEQSIRRWAILELCERVMNHPKTPPVEIIETFLGQITSMIYRMEEKNTPKEKYEPFYEAMTALLEVETYFNEVYG